MKKVNITIMVLVLFIKAYPQSQDSVRESSMLLFLKTAENMIKQIDKEFDMSVISPMNDLNEIKGELNELSQKKKLTSYEVQMLAVLTHKKVSLEDEMYYKSRHYEIAKLETRYEAGFQIINTMMLQLLNLHSKYKDVKLYKSYSALSNPLQYRDFNRNLAEIQQRLSRKRFDITLPEPWMEILHSNTYMATAYSLVVTVLSQLSIADKSEKFMCIREVLCLTAALQSDLENINRELDYLDSRVSSFLQKVETFFVDYTSVISYDKDYAAFIDERDHARVAYLQSVAFSDIRNHIAKNQHNYFITHTLCDKEIEITFNLIRLVDIINEYKALLIETENYYSTFEKILAKYNSSDYPELNVDATLLNGNTFKQELSKLQDQLLEAKQAYGQVLKASEISEFDIRKILYGKPK